jgi:hypothetical protein
MLAAMAVLVIAAIGLSRTTIRAEADEVLRPSSARPPSEAARAGV